jgi:hypothetical protein
MKHSNKLVGPFEIHDSIISAIKYNEKGLSVYLKSSEEKEILIEFQDVYSVDCIKPIDMILYSLTESASSSIAGCQKYSFTNWNDTREDGSDSKLEILAKSVKFVQKQRQSRVDHCKNTTRQ